MPSEPLVRESDTGRTKELPHEADEGQRLGDSHPVTISAPVSTQVPLAEYYMVLAEKNAKCKCQGRFP